MTKKTRLSGSHQKCWLWGRHVVMETLRSARWPVLELHLADNLDAATRDEARTLAETQGVEVLRIEPPDRLEQLCHARAHQGCLAKMAEFAYAPVDDLLAARSERPLYVVLDGIQDPHNLGAMARSAEAFGVDALLLPAHGQVGVTTAVARASAGAVSRIPIAQVEELPAFVDRLTREGIIVVGASEKAGAAIGDIDLTQPLALVIGNEATGIRPELQSRCAVLARIPHRGAIGSLNAAAAAAILLYEVQRQRNTGSEV